LEEETLQKHIKKCKKIVGGIRRWHFFGHEALLMISYKKTLGKVFALGFANGSYKKSLGKIFVLDFANGYL
jgi:hypothetical protein